MMPSTQPSTPTQSSVVLASAEPPSCRFKASPMTTVTTKHTADANSIFDGCMSPDWITRLPPLKGLNALLSSSLRLV